MNNYYENSKINYAIYICVVEFCFLTGCLLTDIQKMGATAIKIEGSTTVIIFFIASMLEQ